MSVLPAASRSGAGAATRVEGRAGTTQGSADRQWAVAFLALLAAVVALRYVAIEAALADPILIGLGFGLALAGVAGIGVLAGIGAIAGIGATGATPAASRFHRRAATADESQTQGPGLPRRLALGLLGGGALVGLAVLGHAAAGLPQLPTLIRGDAFVPWGIATIVVAIGEEAVLRGVVFDRLTRGSGVWVAILITSLVFALMHVPFYGWRVVPLDLGVGIWLAGLRLASGGIVAPSIAHAVADLATWWL